MRESIIFVIFVELDNISERAHRRFLVFFEKTLDGSVLAIPNYSFDQ